MMKMKSIVLLSALWGGAFAAAACDPEQAMSLSEGVSKLTVTGFASPIINYFSAISGMGHSIVVKGYSMYPEITTYGEELIITAGAPCSSEDGDEIPAVLSSPTFSPTPMEAATASGSLAVFGMSSMYLFGAPAFVTAASMLLASVPFSSAAKLATTSTTDSITVDIYIDVDKLLHADSGNSDCPVETTHWKHHGSVFGGYEGCVSEKYLFPCGQYARPEIDWNVEKLPYSFVDGECVETGYTQENRTFWILWGDPLDGDTLMEMTGLNPTAKFPLRRGPYPSYKAAQGVEEALDDSNDAKAVALDFLEYLGAIPEGTQDEWYVTINEGAEQGISTLWAAKALEIASTTCNRDIYVLMEAPAYGYSGGTIASWVNSHSDDFYSGEECLCYPDCNEPTVSINNVGFFPGNIPERLGGDNTTYSATSASPTSPWFESMVFPENPSGVIKTPQLPANRRVCDGVYVWPMYFGMRDFVIPLDEMPDCDGWSYAITKGYSASVRAGFITYKKSAEEFSGYISKIVSPFHSLSYGSLSQWTWEGQMQIQQMMMSRPVDDPTSWVGAYKEIMKEKWEVITEAFEDCPVLELTNTMAGAYAFFVYKDPYLGLQSGTYTSFFMDVLGIRSTTYFWGFRGADPAEYFGEGVSTTDFTRMQLYRDVGVYHEVARRAKIVCSDTSASVGDFLSVDDWQTAGLASRRHLREGHDMNTRRRLLRDELPHLHERKLTRLLENIEFRELQDRKVDEMCAPAYTSSCLMSVTGRGQEDIF